ncbi:hypothetical protein WMY93_022894 [Mugilogobius chulae]|uniref:Uncharacterized protein n=1 Tax=Mugilogobius chulae TaxID=88201 RepID=A0AAW0N4F1_9GOBI
MDVRQHHQRSCLHQEQSHPQPQGTSPGPREEMRSRPNLQGPEPEPNSHSRPQLLVQRLLRGNTGEPKAEAFVEEDFVGMVLSPTETTEVHLLHLDLTVMCLQNLLASPAPDCHLSLTPVSTSSCTCSSN